MVMKTGRRKTTRDARGSLFWLFLVVHCLIGSVAAAVELTDEERDFLREKGTIVFVSQTDYPPFEFTDPADRQREGMMLDMVRWLAVELGFQPQFVDMGFLKAQEAVLQGRADVLTSLFHSEQRVAWFSFTRPLFEVPASIFIRAEQTGITTLADLQGKTIAMQKGDFAREFLESRGIRCTILSTEDFAEATNRVIDGQADAVIGDEQIVLYHLHRQHLGDRIKKTGSPLYIGKNCMAARLDNAQLIGILNKGIDAAARAGVLDKIGKKWLGPSYGARETFFGRYGLPIASLAGVMFALALAAWVWNLQLHIKIRAATELISRREQSLRESEQNLRTFFDSMADLVFVGDCQGVILHCNSAAAAILGFSRSELLGMNFIDLHPPHLLGEAAGILKAMAEGATDTCPLPLATRDGTLLPVETRVWHGQWDEKPCLFGLCKDLSKEQEALQRFNRLFNANPAPLALTDPVTGRFIEVNDAFCLVTGYSREEVIGATSIDLRLFFYPDKMRQAAAELVATSRIRDVELQVRRKNGELLDGLFSGEVIESQGQRYFLTIMIDQTAQKQAERSLQASEKEYRRLFETMVDIFWRLDWEGKITCISPSVTRITGYRPEELLGTDIRTYAVNPLASYRIVSQMLTNNLVEGIELAFHTKNGSRVWLACNARIERDVNGQFVCIEGIARDITEAHAAKMAVHQEFAFRKAIITNVADGLCVCRKIPEHPFVRFTVWNDRMTELTGYTMEAINRLGWYQTLYPDLAVQQKAIERMQSMRQGQNLRAEEWEITCADGTKRTLSISTSFVASEYGAPHILAVLHDTTERRRAEAERLRVEKELLEARKQESLARMAGATAHHFNNKLGAVYGFLELLKDEQYLRNTAQNFLDKALVALQQAVDLSRDMLRYSMQGGEEQTQVDISEAVRQAIPMIEKVSSSKIRVETRLAPNLRPVAINATDLQTILSTVAINAVEAMEGSDGSVRITTGTGFFNERYLLRVANPATLSAGHYAYVRISDHGCGMDRETMDRMFDPFFSTKFVGRGLGLALVDVLVRTYHGGIVVESSPGAGASLVILLPTIPSWPSSAGHGRFQAEGQTFSSANQVGKQLWTD
jgi:PAS domain S-box-containing protein